MAPKTQEILGSALIGLGLVCVGLQIAEHVDVFSLLAVFFGALGGQQIGQAIARSKG